MIDGNGLSPVIIAAAANSNVLSYLTLKRGTTAGEAAGIQFSGVAPTLFVEGCTMVSNRYGIYSPNGMPQSVTLRNTLIARNNSHGVFFNLGSWQGYGTDLANCTLYNCTVADTGGHGFLNYGGINPDWSDEIPVAVNSMFTGNNGYGIYKRGSGPGAVVSNCLFYGNTNGPLYAHTAPASGGNKSRPPRYEAPANLDYRPRTNSPGAAAGLDLTALGVTNDIANTARPQGGAWDMGAYEGSGSGDGPLTNEAYVAKTGSDTTGTGTASDPWGTIAYALSLVAPSGAVRVAAGSYTETVAFGPDKQAITIRGGYQPGAWSWAPASQVTVIDGNGRAPVVMAPGANSNVLSSLTLRGGTGVDVAGLRFAGVLFSGPGNTVFVDGCSVMSNYYGLYGYYQLPATIVARSALIAANTSHAVYFTLGHLGYATDIGTCYLYNCTVADNGGTGFLVDSINPDWSDVIPVAKNTLFTGNSGYGLWKGGATANASYEYCLFCTNALGAITNRGNSAMTDLGNNMSTNPLYYNRYGVKSYRLWSDSPAHNTGKDLTSQGVALDLDAAVRPGGYAFDRGAYENAMSRALGSVFMAR